MDGFPNDFWVLIPIVAILSGVLKTWVKVKAQQTQQQVLGASNKELEQDLAAMRRDRDALQNRLENLEAIVVSQTWSAVQDHSLPPVEKEQRIASAVRREVAPVPSGTANQQRAEQLARRLQG